MLRLIRRAHDMSDLENMSVDSKQHNSLFPLNQLGCRIRKSSRSSLSRQPHPVLDLNT